MQPGFLPLKCGGYQKTVRYGIAIGAGSNLRMQAYVEPGTKYIGETILLTAVLAEAGLPVTGASVRVTITTPFGPTFNVVLRDDGASQDGDKDDGEHAALFTKTLAAGNYQFVFHAEGVQAGTPWVREVHRTKVVEDKRQVPPKRDPKDTDGREQPADGDKGCSLLSCIRAWLRAIFGKQRR